MAWKEEGQETCSTVADTEPVRAESPLALSEVDEEVDSVYIMHSILYRLYHVHIYICVSCR